MSYMMPPGYGQNPYMSPQPMGTMPQYTSYNPQQFNPSSTGMQGYSSSAYTAGPNQAQGQYGGGVTQGSYGGGGMQGSYGGGSTQGSYGGGGGQGGYGTTNIPGQPVMPGGQSPYISPGYGQQAFQPYSQESYSGGSMRPVNQGVPGPRFNNPNPTPVSMSTPPGYQGFPDPLYDPNRPNLQYMPGGPWNVQDRFWNQGRGR